MEISLNSSGARERWRETAAEESKRLAKMDAFLVSSKIGTFSSASLLRRPFPRMHASRERKDSPREGTIRTRRNVFGRRNDYENYIASDLICLNASIKLFRQSRSLVR